MKDKQTPQIIVMGILVAVCVAFVVVKVTGGKGHAKPTSAQTQAQQKTPSTPSKTTGGGSADTDSGRLDSTVVAVQVASSALTARRDPFAPTMDVVGKDIRYVPPPSTSIRTAQVNAQSGSNMPVPPYPVLPFGAGPQNPAQAVSTGSLRDEPVVEEFPSFVLTGVITGRTNVAIIRLGDSRYIVKEGQLINGKYKVVSVSPDGVQLNRDGRKVFLELGGEGNAS